MLQVRELWPPEHLPEELGEDPHLPLEACLGWVGSQVCFCLRSLWTLGPHPLGGFTACDGGPWGIPLSGLAWPGWPEPTLFLVSLSLWRSWLHGAQAPLITFNVPQVTGHR